MITDPFTNALGTGGLCKLVDSKLIAGKLVERQIDRLIKWYGFCKLTENIYIFEYVFKYNISILFHTLQGY